ncbi:hypothetical protein R84B8_02726 [Treponema sp. R8-4-B8]
MITKRNIWNALIIVMAVFAAGCPLSTGDETSGAYSYTVDEFQGGIFNDMSPALTMNDWFLSITYPASNYDSWTGNQNVFVYKDNKLKNPFSGSDSINEDSVFYCEKSLNGQGKKTGQITGKITLTDIPSPGTKVQIRAYSFSQYPASWWNLYKKINMSSVTGASAALNWSLPVYETFKPNTETAFELIVLPGDSLNTYTITVPDKILLSDINESAINIGEVSIRGVNLSGTININYDGNPVPYLELYAIYPVQGVLNITCLSSPEPNTPWSLTYGENKNPIVDIVFKITGYSQKNPTSDYLLFDISVKDVNLSVTNNQNISEIVINIGDAKNY